MNKFYLHINKFKKQFLICLVLFGFNFYIFSQSTLYVFSKTSTFNTSLDGNCQIGDYVSFYSISHTTGQYTIASNQITVSVGFKEGYNDDPSYGCGGACGIFQWYCDETVTQTLNPFDTMSISYNGPDVFTCYADDCLPINYYAILIPSLAQPTNNTRCISEDLFAQYQDGLDHAISGLTWQYFNNSSQWIDIPNFSDRYPLNASIEGIFGPNYQTLFSGNLMLRFAFTSSFSTDVIYSNTVTFTIINCSPHITSFTPTSPTCYDDTDGGFNIKFDRPLAADEVMTMTLSQIMPNGDTIAINTLPSITSTDITADTSYNWPIPQPLGKYLVTYKTKVGTGPFSTLEYSPTFDITASPPVTFPYTASTNVFCNGGSDGTITITAGGGVGDYEYLIYEKGTPPPGVWQAFPVGKDTAIITGLLPATYELKVRDKNACVAKQQTVVGGVISLGNEIIKEVTITEPAAAVKLEFTYAEEPKAMGFTDGLIRARITGGTPKADGSYYYEWKDAGGAVLTTTTGQIVTGDYYITLNNIGKGSYTLRVWDDAYGISTTPAGCWQDSVYILNEPAALQLNIEEQKPVSCNAGNAYNSGTDTDGDGIVDESDDAVLIAHAAGGVQLLTADNGGLPYYYTWKKEDATGSWQTLPAQDSILGNIEAGNYAVNITDKNGIVLGNYVSSVLQAATDSIHLLVTPPQLSVQIQTLNANCSDGTDGRVATAASGGVPPYTYTWDNGMTGANISGLPPGDYKITLTDSRGCFAEAQAKIRTAVSVIYENVTIPTGAGFTDGAIKAKITGGTPTLSGNYTYEWKDASGTVLTTITEQVTDSVSYYTLTGIGKGTYTLTVWDSLYVDAASPTCTYDSWTYTLTDPDPLQTTIEEQKPISCNQGNVYNSGADTDGDGFVDESDDAVLIAHASGGIKLSSTDNGGLPYYYTWKKEDAAGNWQILAVQDSILSNIEEGNYAVNIQDKNGIVLGVYVNNILQQPTDSTYTLIAPSELQVQINIQNANCSDGTDGHLTAIASGGTPPYTYLWNNGMGTADITGLPAGDYSLVITDSRGCFAEAQANIRPPVIIALESMTEPTGAGFTDAILKAKITGGTPTVIGNYTYEWKDESGTVLTTITEQLAVSESYYTLTGIGKGTYTLTVWDSMYIDAGSPSCTYNTWVYEMPEPEPLEIAIEERKPISCNQQNKDNSGVDSDSDGTVDESQDAILIAHATGGVILGTADNNGLPYYYTWKKRDMVGMWQTLNETDSTLQNIGEGRYAVNITDKNGVILGNYVNNILQNAADSLYSLLPPPELQITMESDPVTCNSGTDGTVRALPEGGVPPYQYEWSTGDVSHEISNLPYGTYFVYVTDAAGCMIFDQVQLSQPGNIEIEVLEAKEPNCYQGTDGAIQVNVSGDAPPFKLLWNNGSTTDNLSSLAAGTYTLTVEDASGCKAVKTIVLNEPELITIDLGEDRTLCNEQVLTLDMAMENAVSYEWTSNNGYTSSNDQIVISEAGVYHLKITTDKGCVAEDEIEISASNEDIDVEYLISTQTYTGEEIVLVNVSNPMPEVVEWTFPDEAAVNEETDEKAVIVFEEPGTYTVFLKSITGNCFELYEKSFFVEENPNFPDLGDTEKPFIEEFMVYPNPNDGNFTVSIKLAEPAKIGLRLIDAQTMVQLDSKQMEGDKNYEVHYNAGGSGRVYVLILETAVQREVRKIIVL